MRADNDSGTYDQEGENGFSVRTKKERGDVGRVLLCETRHRSPLSHRS